ncbi:MAG TPA: hydrogenase maturation protease [Blastocatellia bacterium]|nr:hydrogenase maturation protease [Blastocatellia bacterium]
MSQPHFLPLIIGVGNEYRGDDAVGLIVARRLKERLADSAKVLEQSGDGAALMDAWRGADAVIIIDAVTSGAAAGAIHRFDANTRPIPNDAFRCSTHAFGVAEAIELSRALMRLPRSLVVYGIEGKNFGDGVGLSPEVEKAACEAVRQVFAETHSRPMFANPDDPFDANAKNNHLL